ncbi:Ig-like domain-containing protein [Microbacterium sp. CPCC 204701]|uniref:Ig-like domain-containing protein n=1 Tax=Microbacterium sp. CPCC 204701 TaxID=2493084 RepID=UPI00197BC78B|nr:Ig-like domain-containing protein [Microbacterium sp. CPCC 204701]
MTSRRTFGWAAAGIAAAALVAAPLPALAAEDDVAGTGTLTVTRFDDRYADGIFDPAPTAPNGDRDRKNESAPRVLGSDGVWYHTTADGAGDFVFENLPVGEAQVHFVYPNSPGGEVFFDATGAARAADVDQLPVGDFLGSATGYATVGVDTDGEFLLVGMTALRLVAEVRFADGTPAEDLTTVELGSHSSWFPATEYNFASGAGKYEAFWQYGYVRHLPGDLGVRLSPPAGYRVASVTAENYPSDDGSGAIAVTERDGAWWFPSTAANNYFWNPTFVVTLEQLPDTTRPVATLVAPTTSGPFQTLNVRVDATDDRGLRRIVANIYDKSNKLVRSTQSAADGATRASHSATVALPDGNYTVKYNAQDLAGNISKTFTAAFTIDTTAPAVTVKNGKAFTVGADGAYDLVSFKLHDTGKIDKLTLNGVVKDLSDNAWSDLNFVRPGLFGAVAGENSLLVYDVAGNVQTVTFTLN